MFNVKLELKAGMNTRSGSFMLLVMIKQQIYILLLLGGNHVCPKPLPLSGKVKTFPFFWLLNAASLELILWLYIWSDACMCHYNINILCKIKLKWSYKVFDQQIMSIWVPSRVGSREDALGLSSRLGNLLKPCEILRTRICLPMVFKHVK